ncbi:MAG: outer membrane protein assembly factor BamD [Bacteroidota bacterium]|nr:outer membrane protein assembly factor BamD [Bacteroidota bacterium]
MTNFPLFGLSLPFILKRLSLNINLLVLCFLMLAASCKTEYSRISKDPDMQKKLEYAHKYYKAKEFEKAMVLFDQVSAFITGQKEQEEIQYYIAYCNYNMGNYDLASYLFKSYHENYPSSKNAEECYYMYAYSHYISSQGSELDPTNNYKAIDEFQSFINIYPESKRVEEANKCIDKLRGIMATKSYNNAKLYYKIEDYKAAIVALRNAIKAWPDIEQREEMEYMVVKSHYLLALNSAELVEEEGKIKKIKLERYQSMTEAYILFKEIYPQSKYLDELAGYYNKTQKEIIKLS